MEHVQRNPGAQSGDVGNALRISRPHAANILTILEKRGLLTSQSAYASGTGYRRKFYPADATGQAYVVVRRAQALGGPFGIIAAQLMR